MLSPENNSVGNRGKEKVTSSPTAVSRVRGSIDACGHRDRQHDVAILLAIGFAHRATDSLHDVYMAGSRAHEQHGVERRHVDALGQASSVGQDAAAAFGRSLEPFDACFSVQRVVLAVHMAGFAAESRVPLRLGQLRHGLIDEAGPVGFEALGCSDRVRERDGAAERADYRSGWVEVLGVLERPPAADNLGGVVKVDLAPFPGREVGLQRGRDVILRHREHDDLVVGQEILFDRPGERQAVGARRIPV